MGEFENAQAFVDGFFVAQAARVPQSGLYAECGIAAVGNRKAWQAYKVNLIQKGPTL